MVKNTISYPNTPFMKRVIFLITICAFSTVLHATEGTKSSSHSPRNYIMMKKGKLIEVNRGHRTLVKKDITLVNETTIHPNGSIDASSGESLQLKEGEYMTMDGRIRKLKDMVHTPVKR